MLIAIEGIDQAGKQTQAERLVAALRRRGRVVRGIGFPDYETPIGRQIRAFLDGEGDLPAEGRHLLFAANRYERRADLLGWLAAGATVVADRYRASGVAYGMAHGLPRGWLESLDALLPPADLTVLLDADPAATRARKTSGADAYERDTALLARCRDAYRSLADPDGWVVVDAHLPIETLHAQILAAVCSRSGAQPPGARG